LGVQQAAQNDGAILLTNGRNHTMDANNTVVAQVLIRNGRFAAVGNNLAAQVATSERSTCVDAR
jgi:predicted amidohydrolase YtcJ